MGKERNSELDRIAAALHAGQLDQQGVPYIGHLRAVASAVTDAAIPVALFHDTLEDDRAPRTTLAGILTTDELAAVELLTRGESDTYDAYIERIASADGRAGELAREVKRADLRHNLGRLTPELERLRKRYETALAALA